MSSYRFETLSKFAKTVIKQHTNQDNEWHIIHENLIKPKVICFGLTYFDYKVISLDSQFFLYAPDIEVMDTLMHECAHAIVGVERTKSGHIYHGKRWKDMARKLGSRTTARKIIDLSWLKMPPSKYRIVYKDDSGELECVGYCDRFIKRLEDRRYDDRKETYGRLWLMDTKKWESAQNSGYVVKESDLIR